MIEARPADAGVPDGERFPSSAKITKAEDIRRLFRRGNRERTSHLDVFHAASPVSRSRLGLVVPKHGHEIVERNRLKRRLREIGRREVLPRLTASDARIDVLVRARREAYEASFKELRSELVHLAESRW